MTELLAFDVGVDIVGILDLRTDAYVCYRGPRRCGGARRILDCDGVVISFNGIRYDLPKLTKIVGVAGGYALSLKGAHYDMRIHACRDRWPPRDGEDDPILGPEPGQRRWKTGRIGHGITSRCDAGPARPRMSRSGTRTTRRRSAEPCVRPRRHGPRLPARKNRATDEARQVSAA